MSTAKFLSRGIDYLGDLGAKLRDLQGYRTLAHELIQNADDATNATSMSFDVTDEAFIVDNDGVFSDCKKIEESECPWKTDAIHGHRCDFHRFRHIASGDKRGEAGTTGAFGIGFIATYQITDIPELISGGRHWILREDRPEEERIEICPGCPKCASPGLPGTRFTLAWARDPDSALRRALRAEPIAPDGPKRIVEELGRSIPVAMLFLKRLRRVEIKLAGRTIRTLHRLDEGESLILSDGNPENDRIWHIIRGDFSPAADELREKHRGRIEVKRSSIITLAIPAKDLRAGLLCACLPTEQDVGLPFYVNADFFPTNDRKSVILADDYQSEWNREALRGAARVIGKAVQRLPRLLGAQRFWDFASGLKDVADQADQERGEPTLAEFWKQVAPQLRTAPVIRTTRAEWTTAADACLLLQREEAGVIDLLEGLGVHVVHEELRPYQNLLRSESVGIPILDVERICDALAASGLTRRIEQNEIPSALDKEAAREALWVEIVVLLDRQQRTPKAKAESERRLREIALAPGRDGALWPCGGIYSADDATVALFEPLGLGVPFVASVNAFSPLLFLCRPFNAAAAVEAISRSDVAALEKRWQQNQLVLRRLFDWFENRRQEILAFPGLKKKLGALALFPSAGKLHSLEKLALPGNFNDPLGLAELVDLGALGGRREFLRDLGMPDLDFPTYAASRLPTALTDPVLNPDKRRSAIILLANRAGELKDNELARNALAASPLVECMDGQFRQAHECYLDSISVRDCLNGNTHFAVLPKEHEAAVRDLYTWLGVSDEPRLDDVVRVARALASQPYSTTASQQVQKIIAHLGKRVEAGHNYPQLHALKSTRWLPARGNADRWYAANELYAVYQDYLFETQAAFLDAPKIVQNTSRPLLEFLGVHLTPPANLVVKHLLHCASHQIPVNTEVYRFLNDKVGDPALGQLKDKKCLWLGDAYRAPSQVFWGEHPFGRYRWRLGEELRSYGNLLKVLGVREIPHHQDALSVLKEISSEFGSENRSLDDDSHAVLMACWRAVNQALADGSASAAAVQGLRTVKCVPNPNRVLNPPEWIFFENRAGLTAKFGEFLAKNVIARPLDAGNALAVAGVRTLGTAVEIELLQCVDPVEDREMGHRIRERRNEIGRVLDAQGSGQGTVGVLDRLANIQWQAATSVEIRYSLQVFNRDLQSPIEQVPALYQPQQETLLFTRREGHVPWAAIARELAVALFPDDDPGRYAAGLKEALAPESVLEAAELLDELGFARLDTAVQAEPSAAEAAGALGTGGPADHGTPMSGIPGGAIGVESENLTPQEALKRLLGGAAPPPTPPVSQPHIEPSGAGGRSDGRKTSGTRKKNGRPVLRSYLPSPDAADSASIDENEADGDSRSPVDEAGVRQVLTAESESKRFPKEMPPKNPGYDIESRDASGKVVRYIEVKSFSGQWSDTYAVLSRPQFNKARDTGDLFWLYVVERAERDDFRIYRVHNPALKANHFMFDDGWRATAEPPLASEKEK